MPQLNGILVEHLLLPLQQLRKQPIVIVDCLNYGTIYPCNNRFGSNRSLLSMLTQKFGSSPQACNFSLAKMGHVCSALRFEACRRPNALLEQPQRK